MFFFNMLLNVSCQTINYITTTCLCYFTLNANEGRVTLFGYIMKFTFQQFIDHFMFYDNNLVVTLILSVFTLLFLLHLLKTKVYFLDFKIYSFFWSHVIAFLYISTFFIFSGLLKFCNMDRKLDIKNVLHIQEFFAIDNIPKQFVIFLLILSLLLFFMLTIKISRSYLNRELYKLHLYYANLHVLYTTIDVTNLIRGEHSGNTRKLRYSNVFSFAVYRNWYKKFTYNGVIDYLTDNYINEIAIFFERKVLKVSNATLFNRVMYKIFFKIGRNTLTIFRYIPFLILMLVFLKDCFYNNFVLHHIYSVLPFYALFLIWYRVSHGLHRRLEQYDVILFIKMYAHPQIMYIESSQEEKDALIQYMKDWFIFTCPDPENDYDYTHCDTLNAKRFICMRGSYEECPEEAYVYVNYGHHYPAIYVHEEKNEKKWL